MSTNGISDHSFQVIVIGGGPGGTVAALRARELGAEAALVERGKMGGTCTNDGCVPTRVLAWSARLARNYDQFSDYGLMTSRPVLDFKKLLERTNQIIKKIAQKKDLVNHLEQAGVSVFANHGPARFEDPHHILLPDGTRLEGDKFIICAGGHARRFPFPGSEFALTFSDIWALTKLPASVTIVGAAATGSQLASIFADFGSEVNLLEVAPQILGTEDELVSQTLSASFQKRSIRVITGIGGIERLEKEGEGLRLDFSYHGKTESIYSEAVIMAVGWVGNLESLDLENAGVAHERGYIQVNDYLQASVPHIFAAGDITGRMMLVQSASYDSRVAAENAVLGVGQPYKHIIVPHGGFTHPEYGSVGLTEAKAWAQGIEFTTAVVSYRDLDRAVIDDHTEGFCKLIVSNDNHRILGAHVVGEQALEVIQLAAAGMASEMWIEDLAEMELPYPTYTSIIGLTARRMVQMLGVMPLAEQWRNLRKPYMAEWERSQETS